MISGTYLLLEIFGAAALLLWGIRMARTSVMRAYGAPIRRLLPKTLANRAVAFLTGVGAAAVLQSSTAVAIFIASLASLGVVPLPGGLALMLGADVGSAVVAALLALNLKGLWPALILVGYVIHSIYSRGNNSSKQWGRFFLGLGLVMLALGVMSRVSGELAGKQVIKVILQSLADEPILTVLVLAVLTWLAHSSISILLFLASLVTSGVVRDPTLIAAAVLGINLGGGLPALILTWGQAHGARRITLGNSLFRLAGVALGLVLLGAFESLYTMMPGEPGLRVVMLHIAFNLALAILFMGILPQCGKLLTALVPDPPPNPDEEFGPRYIPLMPGAFQAALPLSALTRETMRMGDVIHLMLSETRTLLHSRAGSAAKVAEIRRLDDRVDTLYSAIRGYAVELSRTDLPDNELRRVSWLLRHALHLENVGDIIDKSLLDITTQKVKARHTFSEDGNAELSGMFSYVLATLELSTELLMGWRPETADELLKRKEKFKRLVKDSSERHLDRLRRGISQSLETSSYHLDSINDLQRINSLIAGIAEDMRSEADEPEPPPSDAEE